MATRRKAKRKIKAKRRKAPVTKATTRRKTTTVRKKRVKKALLRRASRTLSADRSSTAVHPCPRSARHLAFQCR